MGPAVGFAAVVEDNRHEHGRPRGWCTHVSEDYALLTSAFVEFIRCANDLAQFVGGEYECACPYRIRLWVGTEGEGGDDCNCRACAADRPEEITVLG